MACCLEPGPVWLVVWNQALCGHRTMLDHYKFSLAVHLAAVKCMGRYTSQCFFQSLDSNHIANRLSFLPMLTIRERNGFQSL